MRNRSRQGITFSLKVKVVLGQAAAVAHNIFGFDPHEQGMNILLLHYCNIPGIG